MAITFRTANDADTQRLLDFYARAVKDLSTTDNLCLWREGLYPLPSDILPPLQSGEFVIAEQDNRLIAAAVINNKSHPDYAKTSWQGTDWRAIHLLCVNQSSRK